mmetsp:Transcript_37894/g.93857  ORF Transcript_37894/g.93857 Transcript_37894/m.93857 type:complete len:301 (+) Transcript_37894:57-959(+)
MPILRFSSCPIRSCSAIASLVPGKWVRPFLMARLAHLDVFLCLSSMRSCARRYSRWASAESPPSRPSSAASSSPSPSSPLTILSAPVLRLWRANVLLLIAFTRFAFSSCLNSRLRILASRARRSFTSSAVSSLSSRSSARSTSLPVAMPDSFSLAMISFSKSLEGTKSEFIAAMVSLRCILLRSGSNFSVGFSRFVFTMGCHFVTASVDASYAALRLMRSATMRGSGAESGLAFLLARRSSRLRAPPKAAPASPPRLAIRADTERPAEAPVAALPPAPQLSSSPSPDVPTAGPMPNSLSV